MLTIRPATAADEEPLGRFGGALMRQHHTADPRRFIQVERPEAGYGRFLVSQITNPNSRVMVAENSGTVIGYVFADVEPTNWMELRGPCGVVQDLYVDETARRLGAGRELMNAAIAWIRSQGRSQVVLMTKSRNEHAQRLFTTLGFRPTMVEMTLDRTPRGAGSHGTRGSVQSPGVGELLRHRRLHGSPVLEDWIWHATLPIVAYAALVYAGIQLARVSTGALFIVRGAALLLVFIGIHNAWDTVMYVTMERARERRAKAEADAAAAAPAERPESGL